MSQDNFGAVAVATGMWVIALFAVMTGDTNVPPSTGVLWTVASSDKVASHPTLVRRSMPSRPVGLRTATLSGFD